MKNVWLLVMIVQGDHSINDKVLRVVPKMDYETCSLMAGMFLHNHDKTPDFSRDAWCIDEGQWLDASRGVRKK